MCEKNQIEREKQKPMAYTLAMKRVFEISDD